MNKFEHVLERRGGPRTVKSKLTKFRHGGWPGSCRGGSGLRLEPLQGSPLWTDRMTDSTIENITFPQLRWWVVNICTHFMSHRWRVRLAFLWNIDLLETQGFFSVASCRKLGTHLFHFGENICIVYHIFEFNLFLEIVQIQRITLAKYSSVISGQSEKLHLKVFLFSHNTRLCQNNRRLEPIRTQVDKQSRSMRLENQILMHFLYETLLIYSATTCNHKTCSVLSR